LFSSQQAFSTTQDNQSELSDFQLYHLRVEVAQRPKDILDACHQLMEKLPENSNSYIQLILIEARSAIIKGKIDEASLLLKKACNLAESHKQFNALADALDLKAYVLSITGKLPEAREVLAQAHNLRDFLGSNTNWTYHYMVSAGYYWKTGNLEKALQSATRGLQQSEEKPNPFGFYPDLLNQTGNIYQLLKRYDIALEYYQKALDYVKENTENAYLESAILGNIGEVYTLMGDNKNALEYNVNALNLRIALNDTDGIPYSHWAIAKNALSIGDLKTAKSHASQSMELQSKRHNLWGVGYCLELLGEIYLKSNEFEKARDSLLQAIDICQDENILEHVRSSYSILSQVYEKLGEDKLALDAYKKYQSTDKEILSEKSQERISQLEVQYKTTQKENEILLLKNERDLQNALIKAEQSRRLALIIGISALALLLFLIVVLYVRKQNLTKQILRQKEALEIAHKKLKKSDREKSDFLNIAAHDIYSPVATIVNVLHGLKKDISQESAQQVELMHKSAMRVINLVKTLLNVRAIEEGTVATECHNLDIVPIIREVLIQRSTQASELNTEVHLNLHMGSIYAMAHSMSASQVIDNLLSNALKYTPKGSTITISTTEDEGHVYIEIENPGKPISEEQCKHIFERYIRLKDRNSNRKKSHGLGLYIVRMLAEKMGGSIECIPQEEQKVVFRLGLKKNS
jgi:signal transduction histidine kinase